MDAKFIFSMSNKNATEKNVKMVLHIIHTMI